MSCRVWSVVCKVWRVSLECKVWSVKCGVQSAQCRGKFKGPPSAPLEAREDIVQYEATVYDDE